MKRRRIRTRSDCRKVTYSHLRKTGLANVLRQSRIDAGYESHGALARKLNVSRPVVTKAENPAHPVPSDAMLAAWAGATGVGLDVPMDLAQRARSGTPDWFMPWRQAEAEA